ncbi:MAG TPA: ATP-binding cassette domain-containing protein [Candidatus Limnocylindrales bacterium]|nr:ATP-binding cassette domain-containing protein [Candidatus Limnocylindrales bacterium]
MAGQKKNLPLPLLREECCLGEVLSLEQVTKEFAGRKVVDNLSCQVREGEVLGMLGHNGAGKTTAIRCILGIIHPDSGKIIFHLGRNGQLPLARVGYVPEERGLYKKQKVLDVLLFLARLKEYPATKARPQAKKYLQKFGLSDWKKLKIEELSKGMAQKVQFIAAVLHEPKLVILDEPFSGLDPVSQEVFKEEIRSLKARGAAIILSSHQMHLVEEVCDRILLMDRGRVVLSGELQQIKEQFAEFKCEIVGDNRQIDFTALKAVRKVKQENGHTIVYLKQGFEPAEFFQALPKGIEIKELNLNRVSLHEIYLSVAEGGGKSET